MCAIDLLPPVPRGLAPMSIIRNPVAVFGLKSKIDEADMEIEALARDIRRRKARWRRHVRR
jgi:hypothetical protein